MAAVKAEASELAAPWVAALEALLADAPRPLPLHAPQFDAAEERLVADCVSTAWVSSVGAYVGEFADQLALTCGVNHAVPCINGTAALHMCCHLLGVAPGDEVLLPTLTFVATANAVVHAGAIPHLVESEPARLSIDVDKLDEHLAACAKRTEAGLINRHTGRRIAALIVVHIFGHPADMDRLRDLADRWGIALIEDAAEALGSTYKDRPAGSLADAAALSFNGNKIITTGSGGAILCQDATLAARATHLTTTAKVAERYEFVHDEVGYNYRLSNLHAALGVAQLGKLPQFVADKRLLAARYTDALGAIDGGSVLQEPADSASNYWLNAVVLDEDSADARDAILDRTNDLGILTRPLWRPMHLLPMYADNPRMSDLSVAESLYRRVINLPSSPALLQQLAPAGRQHD